MKSGRAGTALGAAALLLGAVAAVPSWTTPAGASPGARKVALPHETPALPAGTVRLGLVPGNQVVHLDVVLAGRDPAGLSSEVTAVATPGSPDYRHYLSASQFAAQYGPSAADVDEVTSALRAEGLQVQAPDRGSVLLPVSGDASTVSSAFATPLERVRLPGGVGSLVNTQAPEVPAAVRSAVTGVVGFDGLAMPHAMVRRGSAHVAGVEPRALVAHDSGPQACATASAVAGTVGHTSTELAQDYGLSDLFAQGRTGIGQQIAVIEFEKFSMSDIGTFESCYGLDNPVDTIVVDGTPSGSPSGSGEAALDIELAAVNAPSATIDVYEAPNESSGASDLDVLSRIASDDLARTVSTSWGVCEADNAYGNTQAEGQIFERMAVQGQTMVAASGDTGSEDCYATDETTGLAVDDPGSQPDVLDAGGTSMAGSDVAAQTVWNNCGKADGGICQNEGGNGAGGGGYSELWSKPPWQPDPSVTNAQTDPCVDDTGCRSAPDLSADADPNTGIVAYYGPGGGWIMFGGTSAVAPLMAGFFADIDQGCSQSVGMVGPAVYADDSAANFTDVKAGNNDFMGTQGGLWSATSGYDPATGLGTPVMENLGIALQGGDGCPSVAALSSQLGPVSGGGAITITGGGLGDATSVEFGSAGTGQIVSQSADSLTVVPPSPPGPECVDITVVNPRGASVASGASHYVFGNASACYGYRFVASDGGIFDFGAATFQGSTGGLHLAAPIVGMAPTPSGNGYWLVASDGGIFAFGDARFNGSTGALRLDKPIVGMAAAPDGSGYWLVASDGGIFTFGSARYFGSMGGQALAKPIVGIAATPDGGGYWMVASDGGIFAFGDARFSGSTGGIHLNEPIVGMAPTPDGGGYWLVASDGGIFNFGDARYYGSMGGTRLNEPIVGMAATPDGGGYWLVAADGGIFTFGDATFYGSTGALHLNKPIVGMAAG